MLEKLASHGRRFVSGEVGQAVLRGMVPGDKSFAEAAGKKVYF